MRATQLIAGLSAAFSLIAVVALGDAVAPRPVDVKHPIEWWTRSTASNVALFDSLDKIAWPAAKACWDSTIVADPAWKKHYRAKPGTIERQAFRFGPTIRRWQQQWIVLYGGTPSGPGIEVFIGPSGIVDSAKASLSVK